MDAIERLEAVLDGLDVPGCMPEGDGLDVVQDDLEPTLIGMPGGNEYVPKIEEPNQPTAIIRQSAGAVCPPAPPPMPRPVRPRPVPTSAEQPPTIKVSRKCFFADA
jgi:hypothetical protein